MIRAQERDIIFISSIDWDDQWQAPQELALRLSKAGNRTLYIENRRIRAPVLRDLKRVKRRLGHWVGELSERGVRTINPGLWVHSPLVLPPFGSFLGHYLNRHLMIHRTAWRLGMRDPIIWTFLPTETTLILLDLMSSPRGRVVDYCAGDFTQLTTHVRQVKRSEAELVKRSDIIFAICEELAAHCRRGNDKVHVFSYGLNLNAFPLESCDPAQTRHPEPEEFSWAAQSNGGGREGKARRGGCCSRPGVQDRAELPLVNG